jgi:formylglycine-generating enzyme required for sulfatase activity
VYIAVVKTNTYNNADEAIMKHMLIFTSQVISFGLLFLINTNPAAAFSYSGVVRDSATSALLESVKVQQRGTTNQVYTNSQGNFTIEPSSVPTLWKERLSGKNMPLFFNQSSRSIAWNEDYTVAIRLYNMRGAIEAKSGTYYRAGVYVVPRLVSGVYILELNVDGMVFREKLIATGSTITTSLPAGSFKSTTGKAAATVDTLVFSKLGYLPKLQGVTSGDTSLVITMAKQATMGNMKYIPGGTFRMGSVDWPMEGPIHSVTVSPFYMDSTEVTQIDYTTAMQAIYPGYPVPGWDTTVGLGNTNPAYCVTWFDAALYCNARSKLDSSKDTCYTYSARTINDTSCSDLAGIACDFSKNGYRLPTEAEWEYACRAMSTTPLYWGMLDNWGTYSTVDSIEASKYAVWGRFSGEKTQPVAGKLPNAFGLYDMSGNVLEWCWDWDADYYSTNPVTNPQGPATGTERILRGGCWGSDPAWMRSSIRYKCYPDYCYDNQGFRVVCPW